MKKLFALLLAALMILSMAACGDETDVDREEKKPETTEASVPETTEATEPKVSEPMGTLYVTFGATLELVYDADGNALSITGTNEVGQTLAEAKQDQVGKGCVFALRSILRYAADNNLLGDAKSMVLRVGKGEQLPSEDFLEVIATDCQYLADEECTGVQMFSAVGDKLDAESNLTYAAAKALATRFMGAEEADVTGAETPVEGKFTFICGDMTVTVDAFSGLVASV